MGNTEDRKDALDLMQKSKFMYVTSLDEMGCPETRAMFNLKRRGRAGKLPGIFLPEAERFTNLLGTNTSSRKVKQLSKDRRACLYFADTKSFKGLSVRGTLLPVEDMDVKKALWKPGWTIYYPKGVEDPDFTVLRFAPETARYYHGLKVVEFGSEL